jgi:hypothetical protein
VLRAVCITEAVIGGSGRRRKPRKAAEDLRKNVGKLKARLTARDVDEVLHCRELPKGIPLLRAVRFYLDAHRGQLGAAQLAAQF